jgi:uncharacterized low-complexity protein
MMNLKNIITTAAIASALTMGATTASAHPTALANFNTNYGTSVISCALCHTTADGNANSALNAFGQDFKNAGGGRPNYAPNFVTLDGMNSGGLASPDNGTVIRNNNAPAGGTLANPAVTAATTTPSSGGGGCIASAATTPLMMVLAMLSLGFFVRRKKD